MISQTAVVKDIVATDSAGRGAGGRRLRAYQLLALSLWCGLVAGTLEVGALVLRKRTFDLNQFYWISRHFVWLIPLTNLLIFLSLGLGLAVLCYGWPRRGRWLGARLLCALTLLAPLWAAFPRIYGPAGFLLALGIAARLVPILERHAAAFRRCVMISFPVLAAITPAPGRFGVGRRLAQGAVRGGAAAAAGRLPQRHADRARYSGRGTPQPPRLRPTHQHNA